MCFITGVLKRISVRSSRQTRRGLQVLQDFYATPPDRHGATWTNFADLGSTLYHVGIYWGPYPLLKGSNRGGVKQLGALSFPRDPHLFPYVFVALISLESLLLNA